MYNASLPIRPRDNGDDRKKQKEKLQVCENNWVRKIAGVKRIDKRRMVKLKVEDGVRESLRRSL